MVNLKQPTATVTNGEILPVMFIHNLKVVKSAPQFNEGETVACFIAKYLDGKYAVWDSTWKPTNKYHVFESEQQLHEHFDEL